VYSSSMLHLDVQQILADGTVESQAKATAASPRVTACASFLSLRRSGRGGLQGFEVRKLPASKEEMTEWEPRQGVAR
jgi:hypothetical protein